MDSHELTVSNLRFSPAHRYIVSSDYLCHARAKSLLDRLVIFDRIWLHIVIVDIIGRHIKCLHLPCLLQTDIGSICIADPVFIVLVDRARRIGIEQSHCHGQNQKYRDKSLLAEVPRDLQERRVHCRTPLFSADMIDKLHKIMQQPQYNKSHRHDKQYRIQEDQRIHLRSKQCPCTDLINLLIEIVKQID